MGAFCILKCGALNKYHKLFPLPVFGGKRLVYKVLHIPHYDLRGLPDDYDSQTKSGPKSF